MPYRLEELLLDYHPHLIPGFEIQHDAIPASVGISARMVFHMVEGFGLVTTETINYATHPSSRLAKIAFLSH